MNCRHCKQPLQHVFLDLGFAPPSNAYLSAEDLKKPELTYPLKLFVCDNCWLVQTEDYARPEELFAPDYAYFSSVSSGWLAHAKKYTEMIMQRLGLNRDNFVIEIAANDGYLLRNFVTAGIPCLGIEPAASTAAAARTQGIPIVEDFFGMRLAGTLVGQGKQADLIVANNVLAHVPDINDFVAGFAVLLRPQGVATFEFPHLYRLVAENQFDTVYHEHFSYLSLTAVDRIFAENGLTVFDVEEHPTHGGSLRVFAQRANTGQYPRSPGTDDLLQVEARAGMTNVAYYAGFQEKADKVKDDFLTFLLDAKCRGKAVAGYGAAAKGNTLMNYAGVRPDLIPFVVDRNPAKQGKYLPGSRIPIVNESRLKDSRPDYVVILPWNLKDEVKAQLDYVHEWGGKLAVAVPALEVV